MAHELYGHALDWVRGDLNKSGTEFRSVVRANEVQRLLNRPTRSISDPSIGSK